jgi:hypothetical protein
MIFEDLLPIWKAFSFLHRSRAYFPSGVAGPIPLAEIQAYLDIHQITDRELRAEFVEGVSALDDKFLEVVQAEAEKKKR